MLCWVKYGVLGEKRKGEAEECISPSRTFNTMPPDAEISLEYDWCD
jgi:hypothetical protein